MKKITAILTVLGILFCSNPVYAQSMFEYALKQYSEGVKKTYSDTQNQKPRNLEDILTVVEVREAIKDNEEVYEIVYEMNATIAKQPLVCTKDCTVGGVKSSVKDLECGDCIVPYIRKADTASYLHVCASLDNLKDTNENETFKSKMSAFQSAAWYLYADKNDSKNELYFGYIANIKVSGGKVSLTMYESDGKADNSQVFVTDENFSAIVYDAYGQNEYTRFKKENILNIDKSDFPKDDDDNIDFNSENFDKRDMRYAFIWLNHGKVSKIMAVNYSK